MHSEPGLLADFLSYVKDLSLQIIAVLGGVVDYLNQIMRGERNFSWRDFVIHSVTALFFGSIVGMVAGGLNYDDAIIGAAGGFGGFLGIRVYELAQIVLASRKAR